MPSLRRSSECARRCPPKERSNSRQRAKWRGLHCAEACLRLPYLKKLYVRAQCLCCQALRALTRLRWRRAPSSKKLIRLRLRSGQHWRPHLNNLIRMTYARTHVRSWSRSERLHCHHPLRRLLLRSMPTSLAGGAPSCSSGRLLPKATRAPTMRHRRCSGNSAARLSMRILFPWLRLLLRRIPRLRRVCLRCAPLRAKCGRRLATLGFCRSSCTHSCGRYVCMSFSCMASSTSSRSTHPSSAVGASRQCPDASLCSAGAYPFSTVALTIEWCDGCGQNAMLHAEITGS